MLPYIRRILLLIDCNYVTVLSMHHHKVSGDFVLLSHKLHSHFHHLELDAWRFFYPLQLFDLNSEIRYHMLVGPSKAERGSDLFWKNFSRFTYPFIW